MYIYPTGDDYGYYIVGNHYKTYSKFDAIETGIRLNIHPRWVFNDDIFSKFNWKIEPTESLDELYRQRAQQLRDNYDYLILSYSGGWDSSNILQTFTKNNIHLDEVFTFYNPLDKSGVFWTEASQYMLPKLDIIKRLYPTIKVTLSDSGEFCQTGEINNYIERLGGSDIFYNTNTLITPNKIYRDFVSEFHPHWKKIIESGKKVAIIYGLEKPNIRYYRGKWTYWFQDNAHSDSSVDYQINGGVGEYREYFYWSPNMPTIPIKQGHLCINALKDNINELKIHPKFGRIISKHDTNRIVYPDVSSEPMFELKPTNFALGQKDWLFLSEKNKFTEVWKKSFDHMDTVDSSWKNNASVSEKGLKGMIIDYRLN